MIPVFTYYQIVQSTPGNAMGEADGVSANLGNTSTMASYYADLKLFFQKASAAGGTTVLHVEPDMWAHLQQRATNNDPRTVPVQVAATGMTELSGLPNNAAGLAQAIVKLRDRYAPNVVLGYHFSTWGTGNDIIYSDPSDSVVDGPRRHHRRLLPGPRCQVRRGLHRPRRSCTLSSSGSSGATPAPATPATTTAAAPPTSRHSYGRPASGLCCGSFPYGNTKMLAMNNTWNHYQDNTVETLLDDASRAKLTAYADAGVIAFLFGRGADGATCACDANGDGVTNPAAINGNTRVSLSADDDGGFFRDRANNYYRTGPVSLR